MKIKLLSIILLASSLTSAQLYTPSGTVQASSNNYIGIGTNAPEGILDINANSNIPIIRGNGGYIPTGLRFIDDSYTQPGQVKEWSIWKGNTFNKGLSFMRYDAVNRCAGGICDIPLFLADNGNVGINTSSPQEKLSIHGKHVGSTILLHADNDSNAPADLMLWASEPGLTYSGVGIGNNIRNYGSGGANMERINSSKGGSYIRLLDNEINFNLVSDTGTKQQPLTLHANGNASLQGKFEAKEIKVTSTPTADFVFDEHYNLSSLEDIEMHIKEKKHLPEIASAKVMEKEGVNVGEFQIKLLQKIEELTLYSIEQNKQLKSHSQELKAQTEKVQQLQEENKILKLQSKEIKELQKQVQQLLTTKR
ncbi:hypothetical protein DBR39_01615 [Chryseobacterium sp. KBW03]|uniref:hypothetical protein n=1 Tax=Chryseobacterium sp. KBW03 TaxID=2153362 RepID=UPI000F5B09CD|nr:hypothetical protein [Chryseobacterium sp. KBW03]RQO42599.1 hypothetical protein DBR39_01615 [Chryseobacterium sp. KBW03]